jgi:hypothetical protein
MSTFMFNPLGDVNNVRPLPLIYLAILIVFPQAVQNSIWNWEFFTRLSQ